MQTLDISIAEYHERKEVSSGMIRSFAMDGPWVCYHKYVARTIETDDADSKRLGRIFHLAMEDPEAIENRVVVMPDDVPNDWGKPSTTEKQRMNGDGMQFNAAYKRHRAFASDFENQAKEEGRELMMPGDRDKLAHMVRSVWENPACKEYLGRGPESHEIACVAQDGATGLGIKALADILLDDVIVDFKTTRMSTAILFVRDARKKGYHYQAEHYLRVTRKKKFVIIAVRNEEPWESMCYRVPDLTIKKAREDNDLMLAGIRDCYNSDSWHSLGWGAEMELDPEGVIW